MVSDDSDRKRKLVTRLLITLALFVLYVILFIVLYPIWGSNVATLGILIAAIVGWLHGRVGGTFASALVCLMILLLFLAHGAEPTADEISRAVPNTITIFIVGFLLGWLSDTFDERKRQSEVLLKSNRDLQKALDELKETQQQLFDASRRAGMAEIASGVLHNVGNVLNSVNVSYQLAAGKLRRSELPGLRKAIDLLESHQGDVGTFLTEEERGQKMIPYLARLVDHLEDEQEALSKENDSIGEGVQHIKMIVRKQQESARSSGISESCTPSQLINEAVQLSLSSYSHSDIDLVCVDDMAQEVLVDRHQVLQILINLLSNAKHAVNSIDGPNKEIRVGVSMQVDDRFRITVSDNGIGILEENLPKVFVYGFTTKKNGHGFGLHDAANAAKAMGGVLLSESDGQGHGAKFTLELPVRPETK